MSKPLKPATKPASVAALRRLETVISEAESPSKRVLASRALVLCPLPFRNPGVEKLTRYARTPAGPMEVTFTSNFANTALPHGKDALLLDLLCSEARRTKSPVVTFDRAKELLALFGLKDTSSGRSYQQVAARLERLAALTIGVRYVGERKGVSYTVACGYDLPSDKDARKEGHQERRLIPYHITFSTDFWNDLISHYVPLPDGVLRAFSENPTQYSLAKRLIYRAHFSQSSTLIPWDDLQSDTGSADGQLRRFRRQVAEVLAILRPMLRDAHVSLSATDGGLRITRKGTPTPTLKG